MFKLQDFSYQLPSAQIAQSPMDPRDHSRLLVLDRETGAISHHHFYDLPALLTPNDVLVRNNTKVIPARIFGSKTSGGHVELLLIHRAGVNEQGEIWECLTKPGLKPHQTVIFPGTKLEAVCTEQLHFSRLIQFNQAGSELFTTLFNIGHTPLPPYIDWEQHDEQDLRVHYQTTYAKFAGSAAAPTAGLHFTPEVDALLHSGGVEIEEVTLHVGLGTFLRVKTENIADHHMHSEAYELTPSVADRLNQAKQAGKRIISVGTTTTRVLESCAHQDANGSSYLEPKTAETDIFIYPPYQFKFVDGLLTNFHESQSTLVMLVSAFSSAPNTSHDFTTFSESTIGQAYQTAISEQYRFLSFGDAMLILPTNS
jgi:S-adenosylmethionine:tRNA ribosyltransferase-isomerase